MNNFYSSNLDYHEDEKPKFTFLKGFHAIMPLGALLHLLFFVIFFIKGVTILTVFNFFSVILYIYVFIYGLKKHFFLSTMVVFLEIIVHSILCSILIGWVGGFYVYPLCLLPVVYFVSINIAKKYIYGHLSAFIIIFNYQISNFYSNTIIPPYKDAFLSLDKVLYHINTISASIVLIILIYSFLYEMRYIQEDLEKKNEILKNIASLDALTGLNNRRSMEEKFIQELDNFNKTKEGFFLAIGDIDNFKKINDTYGHKCGDIILKGIANILIKNAERFNMHTCRWGGEEFLILIKTCDINLATSICNRILDEIRNYKIEYEGAILSATMTIGCSYFDETSKTIDDVLKLADENLYKGKSGSKNCIIIN